MGGYGLLFVSAFGAATLLPLSSELVLLAQMQAGLAPFGLWVAATSGNSLGAVVNWWLGGRLPQFAGRRWFPVGPAQLQRGERWFNRYGRWSLLLAWLPVVGDALTVVAGVLRVPLLVFLPLVALGKGLRYGLLLTVPAY